MYILDSCGYPFAAGVRFWRAGNVDSGFSQGKPALGPAYEMNGLHCRIGYDQSHRIGSTDILSRANDYAPRDEFRIFASLAHTGQPMQSSVRIRAAHGFDKGRNDVIMPVAVFIVTDVTLLDAFFRNSQIYSPHTVGVRLRGFYRQFQSVIGGSRIAAANVGCA